MMTSPSFSGAKAASSSAWVPMKNVSGGPAGLRKASCPGGSTPLSCRRAQFHRDAQRIEPAPKIPRNAVRPEFPSAPSAATLAPLSSAIKAVQAATTVLPDPTSPCSNRRMGCGAGHVAADFAQDAGLRVCQMEAERGQKRLDQMIVARARKARAFLSRFLRRVWMARCNSMNSSRASRCARDFDVAGFPGKWMQAHGVGARGQGVRRNSSIRGRGSRDGRARIAPACARSRTAASVAAVLRSADKWARCG